MKGKRFADSMRTPKRACAHAGDCMHPCATAHGLLPSRRIGRSGFECFGLGQIPQPTCSVRITCSGADFEGCA
jgi:hypothetical protein